MLYLNVSGQKEKKIKTSKLAAVNETLKSKNDSNAYNNKHSHKFKNEEFKWKKMQWQPSVRNVELKCFVLGMHVPLKKD